jgi:hypothetical protein
MKQRGQLIVDEFEILRRSAGKSGLELPPEIMRERQNFRKRDQLFKKLKLDPNSEHHVAFLCSIVHDHLYVNKESAAKKVYDDDSDCDMLIRFVRFQRSRSPKPFSALCRFFVKGDGPTRAVHEGDKSIDRFRRRLERAAKKAMAGEMKLTAKRKARLRDNLREITEVFGGRAER